MVLSQKKKRVNLIFYLIPCDTNDNGSQKSYVDKREILLPQSKIVQLKLLDSTEILEYSTRGLL